ncbi:MAG: hypothetical protein H5U19_08965 [Rhodobacteraceae bacterium]|nr:hypothetical protein [Paracoccaceae bacterium]
MSAFTRTDQKFECFARSSLWNDRPGEDGFSGRSRVMWSFAASLTSREVVDHWQFGLNLMP